MTLPQVIFAWLSFDHIIQLATVVASICGVVFSLLNIRDISKTGQEMQANGINSYRLSGVWMLLRTEGKLLTIQLLLMSISFAVLTLPDIPIGMYTSTSQGPWIMSVIVYRKLARLGMSLVAMSISFDKSRWLATVPRSR